MQLDPGSIDLALIITLAFSPDGEQLLAGGPSLAFWSAAPVIWNDPDRAAERLRLLLGTRTPATSRAASGCSPRTCGCTRALEKLDSDDVRVQAALAAASRPTGMPPSRTGRRPSPPSIGWSPPIPRRPRPGCACPGCFAWRRPWCIRIGLPPRPCCCGEARNAARRMGFRPLTRSEPASRTRSQTERSGCQSCCLDTPGAADRPRSGRHPPPR